MDPKRILLFMDPFPITGGRIARGIARFAWQKPDWQITLRGPWEESSPRLPEIAHADGLIIKGIWPALIKDVAELPIPSTIVLAPQDEQARLSPRMSILTLDDHQIGRYAGDYLMRLGHSHLAYCGMGQWWSMQRQAGFVEVVCEHGLTPLTLNPADSEQLSNRSTPGNEGTLRRWLGQLPMPTAILCCHDDIGASLIRLALGMELRVPEDIAVLGINDDDLICEFAPIPLSSIDTGLEQLGFEAAEQLDHLLAGRPTERLRLLARPKIIARRSTDTLAIADPEVAAAVRFIRAQAKTGIGIDAIAEHLSTSRSSLERRFRKVLGRTPGAEIRSARLAHAMQLLTETHMSISQIAIASGYSDQPHFTREFTRFIGTPPMRYRREQQRTPRPQ